MNILNGAQQNLRESFQQSVSNNFGDFIVCDLINHGGFGHVFKLIERKTKRAYALKSLDRSKPNSESKIKNQINIHQSLKNRYILQLNNKFHDAQNYYMVLQYCQKGDLNSYMVKNYPNFGIPIQQVKKFAQQIAKGISYLHKQNIIHGDIKPSNILITANNEVKICDFGLSMKKKENEKIKGIRGTLNYLAPECSEFQYDEKVDIWAFGVVIYQICTGVRPFKIQSHKELDYALSEENIRKIQYPQKMTPQLKDMLKKIFVRNPQNRYSATQILSHPFFTGLPLNTLKESARQQEFLPSRMRSHASTTIESVKKYDMLKTSTDREISKYQSKKSRPSSSNKDYDNGRTKQNYLGRILQKKTKFMQKSSKNDNKQNNMNIDNTKLTSRNTEKPLKIDKNQQKSKKVLTKKLIQPLNTEGMIIKPIVQKNCITKIDQQGISRCKQELDGENRSVLKQIKITPDGRSILMKLNKVQKFYTIQSLPQKYYKEYENCRKVVNTAKNFTPKLSYSKKIHYPIYKDISLTVMYSGKLIAEINGKKIQTTQNEIKQQEVTFAQNCQKVLYDSEQQLKQEVKEIYEKLMAI